MIKSIKLFLPKESHEYVVGEETKDDSKVRAIACKEDRVKITFTDGSTLNFNGVPYAVIEH